MERPELGIVCKQHFPLFPVQVTSPSLCVQFQHVTAPSKLVEPDLTRATNFAALIQPCPINRP